MNYFIEILKDMKAELTGFAQKYADITNKENTDVWNISYNPKNTLCVWFGSTKSNNLLPKNITGGNSPTLLAQNIYKQANLKSCDFTIPLSVEEKEIKRS